MFDFKTGHVATGALGSRAVYASRLPTTDRQGLFIDQWLSVASCIQESGRHWNVAAQMSLPANDHLARFQTFSIVPPTEGVGSVHLRSEPL